MISFISFELIALLATGPVLAYLCLSLQCWLASLACDSPLDGKPLPLSAYLVYSFTLGAKFFTVSIYRMAVHTVRIRLFHLGLLRETTSVALQLGRVMMRSTMCLRIESIDGAVATFVCRDFKIPHTQSPSRVRAIGEFVVTVDLDSECALSCTLDGAPIGLRDGLRVVYWMWCVGMHPACHAGSTPAVRLDSEDAAVRRASAYTSGVNTSAICSASSMLLERHELAAMFRTNIAACSGRHDVPLLVQLAKKSATVHFMLAARGAVFSTLAAHKVDVDFEGTFLSTVVHSVDHHAGGVVDPISLLGDTTTCNDPSWIRAVFTDHLPSGVVETKLSESSVPWHAALYRKLSAIDTELADVVDWCIAC